MITREVRYISSTEVRAIGGSGDSDPLRIEGYASVFNRSAQLPGFRERIKPGAFTRAIDTKQDVVCLFNHDSNIVLGRTTSGTLTLRQDSKGLWYSCDLPNTQTARDIHESIRRGDINGCSFAFNIPDGGQEWNEERDTDGSFFIMRDINNVNLMDVSPVTYPCYSGTDVQARAAEAPMELRSAVDAKNAALKETLVVPPVVEKREDVTVEEELSFQEVIGGLNAELAEDFGCAAGSNWAKWSVCEVYGSAKYAIICSYGDGPCSYDETERQFAKISFTVIDGEVELVGDMTMLDKVSEYVPSEDVRAALKADMEKRAACPACGQDPVQTDPAAEEVRDGNDTENEEEEIADELDLLRVAPLSQEERDRYTEALRRAYDLTPTVSL